MKSISARCCSLLPLLLVLACSPENGNHAGDGIAQVEAARGRLIHRMVVGHGHVTQYQIVAPTEWNFHPTGVAAQGLAKIASECGDLARKAHMFTNAIDPCVVYEIKVH